MLRVVNALALAAMLTVVLFTRPVGATITTADSNCALALNQPPIYLDRQGSSINCGGDSDAKFMSGFAYTGCGGENFKFALKCLDPVYGYDTARTPVPHTSNCKCRERFQAQPTQTTSLSKREKCANRERFILLISLSQQG